MMPEGGGVATLPAAWHGAYAPPPCRVAPCDGKGNGLLATRAIAEGETIFTETPRVCATLSAVPHCAHCCRSMAPPLPGLPAGSLQHWPSPAAVTCPRCQQRYCSEQCRAVAAASYHAVLCGGGAGAGGCSEAAAVVSDAQARDKPVASLEPAPAAAQSKQAAASDQLRAYCGEFVGGALDRCAEYPLMALKLIAMAISELRAATSDTKQQQQLCFQQALVGAAELGEWGLYAVGASEQLPTTMSAAVIWPLMVDAIGMSSEEQAWLGGVAAVELVLDVLCSNGIRITPRSPFDIYMGRLRREGNEERRAAVLVAVQKLVEGALEDQALAGAGSGDGTELSCAAGEMDELLRDMCGVSVGGLYAVHSKINHSCDFNSEVEGYHFDNTLIQVRHRTA